LDKSILKLKFRIYNSNIGVDIAKLGIKKSFSEVEWIAILNQIKRKSKSKNKPTLVQCKKIIYPIKISMGTSSETTAKYKSIIVSGD
jgi:hypothetical protein